MAPRAASGAAPPCRWRPPRWPPLLFALVGEHPAATAAEQHLDAARGRRRPAAHQRRVAGVPVDRARVRAARPWRARPGPGSAGDHPARARRACHGAVAHLIPWIAARRPDGARPTGRGRRGRRSSSTGVAYLALVNVLWFYNDRYVLVLLPIAGRAGARAAHRLDGCAAGWRGRRRRFRGGRRRRHARYAALQPGGPRHLAGPGRQRRAPLRHRCRLRLDRLDALRPPGEPRQRAHRQRRAVGHVEAAAALSHRERSASTATTSPGRSCGATTHRGPGRIGSTSSSSGR